MRSPTFPQIWCRSFTHPQNAALSSLGCVSFQFQNKPTKGSLNSTSWCCIYSSLICTDKGQLLLGNWLILKNDLSKGSLIMAVLNVTCRAWLLGMCQFQIICCHGIIQYVDSTFSTLRSNQRNMVHQFHPCEDSSKPHHTVNSFVKTTHTKFVPKIKRLKPDLMKRAHRQPLQ